ncbi:hypothetical protein [Deinococcus sp.]|uniref:hypothetical protein n=1 Tax=Deinococcus sp. TaxID=47478 RepID=UPI0025F61F13|nr:hypothetical protein [Deinococcus sp.]
MQRLAGEGSELSRHLIAQIKEDHRLAVLDVEESLAAPLKVVHDVRKAQRIGPVVVDFQGPALTAALNGVFQPALRRVQVDVILNVAQVVCVAAQQAQLLHDLDVIA